MVYQIEILNPEAQALLESLVRLRLIRLHQLSSTNTSFWDLLERLRSRNAEDEMTEEEIWQEVEAIRSIRYAAQSHH